MAGKSWHLKNKWERHKALAKSRAIRRNLPDTTMLSKRSIDRFVGKYKTFFIKPVYGRHGRGVTKISKTNGKYRVQSGMKVKYFTTKRKLTRVLLDIAGNRPFLIQQGIDLLSIKKRPIDFRVLYVKPYSKWLYMGTSGKLAAPKRIVTNYRNGGKSISLQKALKRTNNASAEKRKRVGRNMRSISRKVVYRFGRKYKQARRIGVDIGLDKKLKSWILELNTKPGYKLFKTHPNKQLYNKIDRYVKRIRKL
jgi:hypothetical protein